jgi:hypothetical protein
VMTGEKVGSALQEHSDEDSALRLAEAFRTLPWAVLIPAA